MKNLLQKVFLVCVTFMAATLLLSSRSATGQGTAQKKSLEKRVAILEAKVQQLERVVQVKGPDVTIEAPRDLKINGRRLVDLNVGNAQANGTNITIKPAVIEINGQGLLDEKAAMIRLNNGNTPLAAKGAQVIAFPPFGQVHQGSPGIFVPAAR